MRTIDADALVERLKKSHEYHARTSRDEALLARDIRIIKEQPTIDAEPVRHGAWIPMERSLGNSFVNSYKCSACDCKGRSTPHYCPNCGAIMDGGKKSEANY